MKEKEKNRQELEVRKFSTEEQKEITKIRNKYDRNRKFNLTENIRQLLISIQIMDEYKENLRAQAKDCKNLERWLNTKKKENNLLEKMSEYLKYSIDILHANGNKKSKNSLLDTLAVKNDFSILTTYQKYSDLLEQTCSILHSLVIKNEPAKNYNYSKSKRCITTMMIWFSDMTGEKPKCETDRTLEKGDEGYGEYTGKFYNFLLELRPIFKNFHISLGTDKTIGKNANTLINKYKKYQKTEL